MSAEYPNRSLREALRQFRDAEGLTEKYANTGDQSRTFLDRHDTIHILFGTDTSFQQEAMTDYFTIFASDAGWSDLKQYFNLPEQKELFEEIGWPKMIWGSILSLPNAVRVAFRARKMKRKWDWNGYAEYLDRPVAEIRREFGIDRIMMTTPPSTNTAITAA